MRRLILALVFAAIALVPGVAAAQSCTANNIGQFTYTNCSDGTSYTTDHIGQFSYTNGTDGSNATTNQIGNNSYTNFSDGTSATSQRIGNNSYTSYSDGTSATTTRIGSNATTSFSDGTTVSSTQIGGGLTSSTTTSAPPVSAAPSIPSTAPASDWVTVTVNGKSYNLPSWLLIKGSGAAIYLIYDGSRWVFPNWQTFLAYGGAPDLHNVVALRDDVLAQIPLGPIVPPSN